MVEQEALVIQVIGDELVLEAATSSSCQACEVKAGCGTSVLSKWVGKKFTRFQVKNTVDAKVGDQVIVGLPESALVTGSLLIYLLPLVGMIVFALVADVMLSADMVSRDLITALSAAAGFVLALGLCRKQLGKGHISRDLSPVILRKQVLRNIQGHGRIAP